MAFNTTINQLTGSSTFYDWFTKENNEIISKLNQCTVSGVTSGDGVLASLNASSGVVTVSIGGTSGNILSGLTFSGSVSFLGETIIPNSSYKISGITTGTSGYTFGSVVRITSSGYTLAKANDPYSAEMVGVLSSMNSSYSVVTLSGKITGNFTSVSGGTLSPGCVYFLSASTGGNITTTEPSTIGYVSKPVILGLGETAGVVLQYRGNYLNGSAGSGGSGSNRVYFTLPTSSNAGNYGFSAGNFLSYAKDHMDGITFFHKYLTDTGRTAINGWFLSGFGDYVFSLPNTTTDYPGVNREEYFIVGMIENVTTSGSNLIYQLVTQGQTTVVPYSISSHIGSKVGSWVISGSTYNVSAVGITQINKITYGEYNPNVRLGFVFEESIPNWYVDIKWTELNAAGPALAYNATLSNISSTTNYTFNGDFSIWQRSTARDSAYTSSTNTYFADNWIMRHSGIDSGSVQSLQRQSFAANNTDVEGNPEYYINVKCVPDPLGTDPSGGEHSVGHVIEDINTFNDSNITVSFYAKCALSSYDAHVYLARYSGGSQISKETIGTISLQTTWTKHTLTYNVSELTTSPPYTDDYLEIGIDLIPAIEKSYSLGLPTGTNITVSLASFVVYEGLYTSPSHNFEKYENKLNKCQRFYYTTYNSSQTPATKTMLNNGEPVLNSYTFTYLPNTPFSILKLPVSMREDPSVTIYSPFSGLSTEMYNYTSNRDLRNSSRTYGYDGQLRYSPLGTPTVSTLQDTSSIRINIGAGAVHYDVINCHVVADASYPI